MKVRTAIAGTGLSARLAAIGCSAVTLLASVSACTSGTPPAAGGTSSPTILSSGTVKVTVSASVTAAAAATATATATVTPTETVTPTPTVTPTITVTPTVTYTPYPAVAPATGGGGTAGFQDVLLLGLGGAAILAGAGSIAYRRRVIRHR